MEIVIGVALYALPLLLLPFAKARPRHILLVALFASFVGEATYMVCMGDHRFGDLLGFYPFAVFPMGLWAGVLGGVGIRVLEKAARRLGKAPLVILGVAGGGLVGGVFIALYILVVWVTLGSAEITPFVFAALVQGTFAQSVPLLLAGLAAGASSGVLCSRLVLARAATAKAV